MVGPDHPGLEKVERPDEDKQTELEVTGNTVVETVFIKVEDYNVSMSVDKDVEVVNEGVKNSSKNEGKDNTILTMVGPDHSGLQKVQCPNEDKQTELEVTGNTVVETVFIKVEDYNDSMSVDKDVEVVNEGVKNSSKNEGKDNTILTMVGPDHSGLQKVQHPDEDKQTELEVMGNTVFETVFIKVEEGKDSMSVDKDVEVLNEGDKNSSKNQRKHNTILAMVGPDHSGLQKVQHPDEDKQTELEVTGNTVFETVFIKVEEGKDSMSVDKDVELLNEAVNHANQFVASLEDCVGSIQLEAKPLEDRLCKARGKEPEAVGSADAEKVDQKMNLLKYEDITFGCTQCCKDFPSEQEYNKHMCMQLSPRDAVSECSPPGPQLEAPVSKRRRICRPRPSGSGSRPAPPVPADADTDEGEGTSRGAPNVVNYGSELESGEEDDQEDLGRKAFRAIWVTLETPEDQDICIPPTDSATASTAVTHSIGPSFYDFQWKPFPDSQIPHELRRETFSNIDVGPTPACVDPYDTFVAIWDRQLMEHIASETNRYTQQVAHQQFVHNDLRPKSSISSWRDTTADELYVYLGLLIGMGVVVKDRVDEYWDDTPDIFYTPGFSVHMSLGRFQLLSKYLHFNNNEELCALKLDVSEAKLFKIEPLVSHLNCRFQSLYKLSQNIAVDETLLVWRDYLDCIQSIPGKATTAGIKTIELCEPQTGYLWRFVVYAQKRSQEQASSDPLDADVPAIVLRLVQGLEYKGHTLWMDHYYNSPLLARKLKSLGFDCAGTLRTNRPFLPGALTELTEDVMSPGQLTGFTSGDVDVMVWRGRNRVAMISTYHGDGVDCSDEFIKPTVFWNHLTMMSRLDKKDEKLETYSMEKKGTRVWYKILFHRLLNVSVLNSYVLYKQSSPKTSLDEYSFRTSLCKSLFQNHHSSVGPALPQVAQYPAQYHYPAKYTTSKICKGGRIRRICVLCYRRVNTYCAGCKKTVCMTCFAFIHPE